METVEEEETLDDEEAAGGGGDLELEGMCAPGTHKVSLFYLSLLLLS